MYYTLTNKAGAEEHASPRDYTDKVAPALIADLSISSQVLWVFRDAHNRLEIARFSDGFVVTEVYENRRFHLRGRISAEQVVALLGRYRKESVSDAKDWYPSLVEWKGLRFSRPTLFALLNERYRVSSALAMTGLIGFGVILCFICFGVAAAFDLHTKLIFLPLGLYGIVLAKRIDFSNSSKSAYGYGD